jgi:hypothetical protein
MLGLLALAGCGKKPAETTLEAPKVDTRFRIYLVDNPTVPSEAAVPILERAPISQGPAGSPFGIVVTMTQLQPSWRSSLSCRLESPAGKAIFPFGERDLSFGTNEQGEGWVFIPVANDSPKYHAGSWKAVMGVAGLGEIPFGFAIAPPTAAQKAALADHEEAQKQVLRAFAAFWVAFPHPDLKMTFVTSTKAWGITPQNKYNLFQAAGLGYECTQSYISDADRLNGISYRGSVGFGFTLHRQYTPEKRWTDWRDVDRPSGPINETWQKYTGNNFADPDSSPQAPGMRFTVEKRDGNWVVTSREKARFINGIRRDDDATLAAAQARNAQKEKEAGEMREREAARRKEVARERALEVKMAEWRAANEKTGPGNISSVPPSAVSEFDIMLETDPLAGTGLQGKPGADYGQENRDPVKDVLNSLLKERTTFSSELFSDDEEISPPPFEIIRMLTENGGTERSSQKQLAESLEATPEEIKAQQQATLKALEDL